MTRLQGHFNTFEFNRNNLWLKLHQLVINLKNLGFVDVLRTIKSIRFCHSRWNIKVYFLVDKVDLSFLINSFESWHYCSWYFWLCIRSCHCIMQCYGYHVLVGGSGTLYVLHIHSDRSLKLMHGNSFPQTVFFLPGNIQFYIPLQ